MRQLEERIRRDGAVLEGQVLKVDTFLNHRLDVKLLTDMGREFARLFAGAGVTKILTVEASGIALACLTAQPMGVDAVFAKKNKTKNMDGAVFKSTVTSYTRGGEYDIVVARYALEPADKVLLIDDFLASGSALLALMDIVRQAGATVAGAGVAIEKAFQDGGALLRARGVRVEALARIAHMDAQRIIFAEE